MNNKGFAPLVIVLAVVVVLALGGTWYYVAHRATTASTAVTGATTTDNAGVPHFSAEPQSGTAPLTVQFRSTASQSSNISLGRSVDFGDGASGSLAFAPVCSSCDALTLVSHIYKKQGTYTATLLDASSSALGTTQVTVSAAAPTTQATTLLFVDLPQTAYTIPSGTQYLGPASTSTAVETLSLILDSSPAQKAALQTYLSAPRDHNLTVAEYTALYAPSEQNASDASAWLTQNRFTSVSVASNRVLITFSGTLGQLEKAFNMQINNYVMDGRQCYANPNDEQIPAYLSSFVQSVRFSNCGTGKPAFYQ